MAYKKIVKTSWINVPCFYTNRYLFPYLDTKTGELIVIDWFNVGFADYTKEEMDALKRTVHSDFDRYYEMPQFLYGIQEEDVYDELVLWCKKEGIEIIDDRVA